MKSLLLVLLFTVTGVIANAQTPPVWSTDIAPIMYNKCASCHRPDGIAPFSLLSFSDASALAQSIKAQTNAGHMPPWPPDPHYRRLANERILSVEEKARISAWVDAGAPQGNPVAAPPVPTFPTGGELPGTPQLVVQIPAFTSTATTSDLYRCFVVPTNQTADQFITAFEAIPGNRSIVHHVLVYADTTGASAALDAQDPGPGYTSFGGIGVNNAVLIGGWVPGSQPMQYPQGFGVKLSKKAKLVLQIHYPAGSNGTVDSTKLRIFFSSSPSIRPVLISPVLNHQVNISPSLVIPANTTNTFREQYQVGSNQNYSLLGIAPHMHLIGRNITTYGVQTSGDTVHYISIPDWDFHWQGFYFFRNILKVAGGTKLISEAFYDNTTNNPENPSSPPVTVTAGEGTTDEMMLNYFILTGYQAGDENIIIDATPPASLANSRPLYSGQQLLAPYPNPATNTIYIKCHLQAPEQVRLDLMGLDGRNQYVIDNGIWLPLGYSVKEYKVPSLPSGTYMLRMFTTEGVKTEKIAITN
jgi:hypothetical protein